MMDLTQRLSSDGSVTIFLFHGVIERQRQGVRNYTRKHLPAVEFRSMLESIGRVGQPLSMDDVVRICRTGQPFPKGAFAITFDDGFENNLTVAKPILDDLGVPAIVYITSGFVDENGMSWIDRIEYGLELAQRGELLLPWSEMPSVFEGDETKIEILNDIRRHVKSAPTLDVDAFVSDVFRQLHLDEVRASNDQLDQKLTWDQVRSWCAAGHLVGGHSHTHAILSFLAPSRLEQEVDTSLRLLKKEAGIVTPHYSYPEGLRHCYSENVIDLLKTRGITCCPTAIDGINRPGTDPFHLRRVMVN